MVNIQKYRIELVKESGGRYDLDNKKITSPYEAATAIKEIFKTETQPEEVLMLLTLDTKNKITGAFEVARGSINTSIVHPREVFKRAITMNAAAIIIGHNHPSGEATPSSEDINITHRLKECAKLLGIDLLDHIVWGDTYVSLKERGII